MTQFFTLFFSLVLSQNFVFNHSVWAADTEAEKAAQKGRYHNLELFQKVLHFVENNYVEEVKNKDLIYGAIKGMMDTLDPHSNFLPPEIFKDMKIDTSGEFGGLGIEIGLRDGVLTVVAPIEDSPAWKAGIKPGDRIVKIDGDSTKGLNLSEAVIKMRGKKGSKVDVTIFRKGFDKTKVVSIVRETIKIRSVKNDLLESGFGYVRLSSFNESASKDIEKAMSVLEKQGKLKGMVLDLRTNPGGLLDQAVEVASLFVDNGVIVSTIGRNKDQKEVRHAKHGKARKDFPLAVLVNSSTASAAEIVAGSLQDLNRAIVIGQPTFGKGSVQTVIELGEDMGLKLTIARYYTSSGRSIQEEGVIPDIVIDQYDPDLLKKAMLEKETLREKDLPGHIVGKKQVREEFTDDELVGLEDGNTKKQPTQMTHEDLTPNAFEPKKDYEVQQALNYLKSFEVFKKILDKQKKKDKDKKDVAWSKDLR